jgi:hypothetical protein
LRRLKNTKIKIWQYILTDESPVDQKKFILMKKCPKSDVYGLNKILFKV